MTSKKQRVEKKVEHLQVTGIDAKKGIFEHYTLKEINEQPQAIRNALEGRCLEEYGTAIFDELKFEYKRVVGCRTYLNSGLWDIVACGLCGLLYDRR